MNFIAQMRLGSMEVLAALSVFIGLSAGGRANKSLAEVRDEHPDIALEVNDAGSVRSFRAYCPFTIGRASSADLVLSDPAVSRLHARLENDQHTVFLTDLGSSNGTYLNGERVTDSIELRPGDTIEIGAARVNFLGVPSRT